MSKTLVFVGIFFLVLSMAIIPFLQDSAFAKAFDRSHVTGRHDRAMICGGHYCTPSEYNDWRNGMIESQRVSQGKIANPQEHGEDVMHKMAGSTPGATTMHGNTKQNMGSSMQSAECQAIMTELTKSGFSPDMIAKAMANNGCS